MQPLNSVKRCPGCGLELYTSKPFSKPFMGYKKAKKWPFKKPEHMLRQCLKCFREWAEECAS